MLDTVLVLQCYSVNITKLVLQHYSVTAFVLQSYSVSYSVSATVLQCYSVTSLSPKKENIQGSVLSQSDCKL